MEASAETRAILDALHATRASGGRACRAGWRVLWVWVAGSALQLLPAGMPAGLAAPTAQL